MNSPSAEVENVKENEVCTYEENGSRDFDIDGRMQDGDVKINSNGEDRNSLESQQLSAYLRLVRVEGSWLLTGIFDQSDCTIVRHCGNIKPESLFT
jgi:hypothetical protein